MKKQKDYTIHLLIGLFLFAVLVSSCYTEKRGYGKSGCGSYSGWESHTKFRSK